jgi:glycosyltransferase involved in cell wall biosynthesis
MRVLMATNTYLPHVGGVANGVDRMVRSLRKLGHEVLVVAPGPDATTPIHADSDGNIRIPSIPAVGGSDFSMPLYVVGPLTRIVERFDPDIVHAHHPFLLGRAALVAARALGKPILFHHHTLYEHYTQHFAPKRASLLSKAAVAATSFLGATTVPSVFANACDAVCTLSESVAQMLVERGVTVPVYVTPSGIDVEIFSNPGTGVRKRHFISPDAFVVGHVGRLSKEKNLGFLARAISKFMLANSGARAIIVGKGPCSREMDAIFRAHRVSARVRWLGVQRGQALADAYGAMDVFAFSSTSETQGIVLAEAMAAGVPIVAVDGPGTRDIVRSGVNGQIVKELSPEALAAALLDWSRLPRGERDGRRANARKTGASYARELTTRRLVRVYEQVARPVRQVVRSAG